MRHRIARLVKDGLYKEAIVLYTRRHSVSLPQTNFTFPYILKACAELKSSTHGQMLHASLFKSGYINKHTTTDLTNMYMKLGLIESATKLFDEIPLPSVSLLNVVISGFLQNGLFEEGFRLFKVIGIADLRFDSVTVASVVSACRDSADGAQLHCFAVKTGVEMDADAATSLMTMYFNSKELDSAEMLFVLIEHKHVICYNAYLSGMVQNDAVESALRVFIEMRSLSCSRPNPVTMMSVLSGCGDGNYMRFGRQLHGFIVKVGFKLDAKLATSLVDMYSKCGLWQCAYGVFRETGSDRSLVTWNSMIAGMMLNDQSECAVDLFLELEREGASRPDLATWNSMISGFEQLSRNDDAILFFRKMLSCGEVPNVRCLTSLLAACSSLSEQRYGRQIHAYVLRLKLIDDEFLATAIIDMYMKCGLPSLAYAVFSQFRIKPVDAPFWNAMISGYGRNGDSKASFDMFGKMIENKVKPDSATFSCLLTVCSQTGEVHEGFRIFRLMTVGYGLNPTSKHMNILIDLLGRSGRLDEALEVLRSTDESSAAAFASLLGACKQFLDSKTGDEIAGRLMELEPGNPIPFVILSNIYAGQEKWRDVQRIRKMMEKKGLKKLTAISAIGAA
ncbi:pentatricopeptide repeat-containing protein At2g02750-like [Andrographis paniculata]|uniref:pentatricopeptide repeat-containing protein At2g02750-like n=1 Tax=Andrographis paniculata TaxID=175694 RepID=UPI0021E7937D|nr:pentatricopeptide repeat-containing protein At2g02750-like [Andrographis paniculata]